MKFLTKIDSVVISKSNQGNNLNQLNKLIDEINKFVEMTNQAWLLDAGQGAIEIHDSAECCTWREIEKDFSQRQRLRRILFLPNSVEHAEIITRIEGQSSYELYVRQNNAFCKTLKEAESFGIFLFMHADELYVMQFVLDGLLMLIEKELTAFESQPNVLVELKRLKDEITAQKAILIKNLRQTVELAKAYECKQVGRPAMLDHHLAKNRGSKPVIVIDRLATFREKLNDILGEEIFYTPKKWCDDTLSSDFTELCMRFPEIDFGSQASIGELIKLYLNNLELKNTANSKKQLVNKILRDYYQSTKEMAALMSDIASPDLISMSDGKPFSENKNSFACPAYVAEPNSDKTTPESLVNEIYRQLIDFSELRSILTDRWNEKFEREVKKEQAFSRGNEKVFRASTN